jgi:hypothetical protein
MLLLGGALGASAEQPPRSEVDELKLLIEEQEEAIRALKTRVDELERRPAAAAEAPAEQPPPAVVPAEVVTEPGAAPAPAEEAEAVAFPRAAQSRVAGRGNLDDRQEAAARPGDYVLDPTYRGFIPIPRTVFMVKFNPKPRLDMTLDNRNPGAPYRFVPARFPIEDTTGFGGGSEFNATANGSQIRVDMRAPSLAGNFRLFYQNDFFGSDQNQMQYRLQHLYGQAYGVVGGFTYGVFEDPDSWPDTVDYEGPNALIFARRPVLHYTMSLAHDWNLTLGIENPALAIDANANPGASRKQRAPDGGFNVRWEPGALGHVQFSTILRSLAIEGGNDLGRESAFGWGINLGGSFALTDVDTMQFLGVVGEGVGGLGNDSGFDNTDAAINGAGDLEALTYLSGMLAFTHKWTPRWRSTGTFGYVHVDNTSLQDPSTYHETQYGSVNLVYQLYKRVSVGIEGLYGFREVANGDDSHDVLRLNLGVVYAPFD